MENTTQITVADLDAIRGIMDIAAQRGAFRGAELAQVGAVFDKLTAFLNFVAAQAKANADQAAANDSDASTESSETATTDTPSETTQGE